ncbi:hypothetical protein ES319_D11G270000v1 [Gossypium barbadense]|uniref:Uncharacterized protein n=1 Tax=Gossypium barbadense TaxID=3634 RepID=A0A5J5PHK9_GOSBA|nr:hypothetical protein ES319_D11G270000v1 [Gossypium barbadense]
MHSKEGKSVAKKLKQRMLLKSEIRHQERGDEGQRCVGGLRSYTKTRIGKKKFSSSSSIGVMTSLTGKGGIIISDGGKKMYKRSIQKAKETTRLKRRKAVLRNKIEQKTLMRESLQASKRDAAEGKSRYRLSKMMRNELRDEVNRVIKDFVRLRALEILVMQEMGFF